ncbi:hypothetical protein TI03_05055, partial [Achromatium sp. WMS1]
MNENAVDNVTGNGDSAPQNSNNNAKSRKTKRKNTDKRSANVEWYKEYDPYYGQYLNQITESHYEPDEGANQRTIDTQGNSNNLELKVLEKIGDKFNQGSLTTGNSNSDPTHIKKSQNSKPRREVAYYDNPDHLHAAAVVTKDKAQFDVELGKTTFVILRCTNDQEEFIHFLNYAPEEEIREQEMFSIHKKGAIDTLLKERKKKPFVSREECLKRMKGKNFGKAGYHYLYAGWRTRYTSLEALDRGIDKLLDIDGDILIGVLREVNGCLFRSVIRMLIVFPVIPTLRAFISVSDASLR